MDTHQFYQDQADQLETKLKQAQTREEVMSIWRDISTQIRDLPPEHWQYKELFDEVATRCQTMAMEISIALHAGEA